MNKADLLRHWRHRIHRVQHAHYESGRLYERRHYFIGVPSIILSTVVGTAVFSSLVKYSESVNITFLTIGVGLLSITSAVLTALQTFLNYKDLAERHKISGAKFADLKHKVEIIATFTSRDDSELKEKLEAIENEWVKIREESPNFPTKIWNKIEKEMTLDKDKKMHPEFGSNA